MKIINNKAGNNESYRKYNENNGSNNGINGEMK
jgi:hypothetical protein